MNCSVCLLLLLKVRSLFVEALAVANELVMITDYYWSKGRGLGLSQRKKAWEENNFPDLQTKRKTANDIFQNNAIIFETIERSPHDLQKSPEYRMVQ